MQVAHGMLQAIFHSLCFPGIGYRADDVRGFHDLAHRHTDGLQGYVVYRRKPSFVKLLCPAGTVKINHQIRLIGVEIRRRIVKSEVSVFADAYQCHVNGMLPDQLPQSFGLQLWVGFPVDKVGSL